MRQIRDECLHFYEYLLSLLKQVNDIPKIKAYRIITIEKTTDKLFGRLLLVNSLVTLNHITYFY